MKDFFTKMRTRVASTKAPDVAHALGSTLRALPKASLCLHHTDSFDISSLLNIELLAVISS